MSRPCICHEHKSECDCEDLASPTIRGIMRDTARDTDVRDFLDAITILGTLAAAYGALWLLFGSGSW